MVEGKLNQGMRFGFTGWAETSLLVKLGPAMRPVPVEVDSARRIFIEVAVAVVVDTLCIVRVNRAFPLGRIGLAEDPRVVGIGEERGLSVFDPHPEHETVTVQVVRAIFSRATIAVTIERMEVRSYLGMWGMEKPFSPIWVEPGNDVNRASFEQLFPCGIAGDALDQPNCHLAADNMVGFQVRNDQDSGEEACRRGCSPTR